MKKLFGVITAMTTPFTEAGEVDVQALEQMTEYLVQSGVNCLYPCGTTGEMFLMSESQRKLVAETVVRKAAGRVTVYIHTGAMSPDEVVRLSVHAYEIGADGVGIVTPTYFTVNQRAMVEYYRTICQQLPKGFPVYVYVIPMLAGNDVDAQTMQLIADACRENVIGVKYSFADMRRLTDYIQVNSGSFSAVFGPDDLFLSALIIGADGTVSGCSGCIPEPFVAIYKAFQAGDFDKARALQIRCYNMVRVLKRGADMSIFKNILIDRGIQGGHMKKPLLDLGSPDVESMLQEIRPYYQGW